MKRGMILYVNEEKDEIPQQGTMELIETSRSLGVSAVSLAFKEEDVVSGWVHLIAEGVGEVLFMTIAYDAVRGSFASTGKPVRLCG
jgi:hypothetical protein